MKLLIGLDSRRDCSNMVFEIVGIIKIVRTLMPRIDVNKII
jgi:hypothetical protein